MHTSLVPARPYLVEEKIERQDAKTPRKEERVGGASLANIFLILPWRLSVLAFIPDLPRTRCTRRARRRRATGRNRGRQDAGGILPRRDGQARGRQPRRCQDEAGLDRPPRRVPAATAGNARPRPDAGADGPEGDGHRHRRPRRVHRREAPLPVPPRPVRHGQPLPPEEPRRPRAGDRLRVRPRQGGKGRGDLRQQGRLPAPRHLVRPPRLRLPRARHAPTRRGGRRAPRHPQPRPVVVAQPRLHAGGRRGVELHPRGRLPATRPEVDGEQDRRHRPQRRRAYSWWLAALDEPREGRRPRRRHHRPAQPRRRRRGRGALRLHVHRQHLRLGLPAGRRPRRAAAAAAGEHRQGQDLPARRRDARTPPCAACTTCWARARSSARRSARAATSTRRNSRWPRSAGSTASSPGSKTHDREGGPEAVRAGAAQGLPSRPIAGGRDQREGAGYIRSRRRRPDGAGDDRSMGQRCATGGWPASARRASRLAGRAAGRWT